MRYLILILAVTMGAALTTGSSAAAGADGRNAVFGRWAGDRSILEIRETDGNLSATIVAMLNLYYLEDEGIGVPGEPRVDLNNPDDSLRDRTILGMNLLSGYRYEDGLWQGKIYDPESGKVYSSRMKVNSAGELEMRGYIGAPMFGRTAVFVPADRCSETTIAMLGVVELPNVC